MLRFLGYTAFHVLTCLHREPSRCTLARALARPRTHECACTHPQTMILGTYKPTCTCTHVHALIDKHSDAITQ